MTPERFAKAALELQERGGANSAYDADTAINIR